MSHETATLAGGCFWCLETVFNRLRGVASAVSGYMGGHTPNPTYQAVCNGDTGHAEVVQVRFDPEVIAFRELLDVFFTIHDPTQIDRQGNDVGTQYRSMILTTGVDQRRTALASRDAYQAVLSAAHYGSITTEVAALRELYYAEDAHQQYLAKNPDGYCGLGGTGVSCPVGLTDTTT